MFGGMFLGVKKYLGDKNQTLEFACKVAGKTSKTCSYQLVVKTWRFTMVESERKKNKKKQGRQWDVCTPWPHIFVGSFLWVLFCEDF